MKPKNEAQFRTKHSRSLMTVLVILSIPLALLGLFFVAIGISGGAIFGRDLKGYEIGQYVGKGVFMLCMGLLGGGAGYK